MRSSTSPQLCNEVDNPYKTTRDELNKLVTHEIPLAYVQHKRYSLQSRRRLLVVRLVFLSLLKPLEERLGTAADLLRSRKIDVLLASLASPLGDDLLAHQVLVVQLVKDLDDLVASHKLGMILALSGQETLNPSEQSLLVTLRCNKLKLC